MAGEYKRIYIQSGIMTIIALFGLLQVYGIQIIDQTGDITCAGTIENPCISYFKVYNPTAKSFYIYNSDNIKMLFSPDIKGYELYVKYYGKWVPMDFTDETKLSNVPSTAKYVFVFPRYSTKEFKLVGYKYNPEDDVKWTFGTPQAELDPIWKGIPEDEYVRVIENKPCLIECETIYEVCNPTDKKMSLAELGFDVNFRTKKDMTLKKTNIPELRGYTIELEHNVTKTKQEPVYKTVTKQISVIDNVTKKNITKDVETTEFDKFKITDYIVKEYKSINSDKIEPYTCVMIKISGTKKPNEAVDNVITFNGKTYDKYAWWNASYGFKYQIIQNTTDEGIFSINDNRTVDGTTTIWSYINDDSYVYSSESGPIGLIAIANDTDEKYWENQTSRTGNDVASLWSSMKVNGVWHLEEASGNIADSSGNANTGTAAGTPVYQETGKFGKSIRLDGSTEYFNFGNVASLDNIALNITYMVWVQRLTFNTQDIIFGKDLVTAGNRYIQFAIEDTDILNCHFWDNSDGYNVATSSGTIVDSNWHLVTCGRTHDGYVRISIDGVFDGVTASTLASVKNGNTEDLILGAYKSSAPTGHFDGRFDEPRVYNRSLTIDEIKLIYWNGIGNHTRLGAEEISTDNPITFSANSTDTTDARNQVYHSITATDDTNLTDGGYIFSFNNGTGTFTNDTWIAFTEALVEIITVGKYTNISAGTTMQWIVYANDTVGNWSVSSTFAYTTTCRFQGTVKDNSAVPVEGAIVILIDQVTNTTIGTNITDASGNWQYSPILNGSIYTIDARYDGDTSKGGAGDPHITCS